MNDLSSSQRKYLRSLAHGLKPQVFVGKQGVTETLIQSVEDSLRAHELIKIKFIDHKEKADKQSISDEIATRTTSHAAGMVGHVLMLYREHPEPEKRRITLPE